MSSSPYKFSVWSAILGDDDEEPAEQLKEENSESKSDIVQKSHFMKQLPSDKQTKEKPKTPSKKEIPAKIEQLDDDNDLEIAPDWKPPEKFIKRPSVSILGFSETPADSLIPPKANQKKLSLNEDDFQDMLQLSNEAEKNRKPLILPGMSFNKKSIEKGKDMEKEKSEQDDFQDMLQFSNESEKNRKPLILPGMSFNKKSIEKGKEKEIQKEKEKEKEKERLFEQDSGAEDEDDEKTIRIPKKKTLQPRRPSKSKDPRQPSYSNRKEEIPKISLEHPLSNLLKKKTYFTKKDLKELSKDDLNDLESFLNEEEEEKPRVPQAQTLSAVPKQLAVQESLYRSSLSLPEISPNDVVTNMTEFDASNVDEDKWPQVIFTNAKTLEMLSLSHLKLKQLPLELEYTSALKHFEACFNGLNILNAKTFKNLNNLVHLDLKGNQIESLPSDLFSHLSRLTYLNLYKNQLNELPIELPATLQTLDLAFNRFSIFPLAIERLINLKSLNFSGNQLTKTSRFQNLRKLTKLERLNLSNNQLEEIPNEIFYLLSLEEVNLSNNKISSVNENDWKPMKNLTDLILYGNRIENISPNFEQLTMIE